MAIPSASPAGPAPPGSTKSDVPQLLFFSELLKRPICVGKVTKRVGRLTDLVFRLSDPYPQAVGIYVEHGFGQPTELIPWDKVTRIEDDAIFIIPAEGGGPHPPFVDQAGWILINEHLMGRTVFDMDGRRIEVVNDVHLLASQGHMLLVHVDISFNGFWRKWGLRWLSWSKDRLISWRYIQPLSLEDVGTKDSVTLSITRKQIKELPGEDLADALETLSGAEQQAVFSALDSEKAAEVLVEAEPRAQRQLIANIRRERARTILSEMSIPQLADLFSVLPHDDMVEMMELLSKEDAARIRTIISEREASAHALMSTDFAAFPKEVKAEEVLRELRELKRERDAISYVYVVGLDNALVGVVDLRDLVLAEHGVTLGDLMVSPVVAAESDDVREDLVEMFVRYHFRLIPVVDRQDRLLGVLHYRDIMKGLVARTRA
jgi:CBS domain-containing protein/sporulation protein YlmC with PRC-barrel domain